MIKNRYFPAALLFSMMVVISCQNDGSDDSSIYLPKAQVDELMKLEKELMESPLELDTARSLALAKKYLEAAEAYREDTSAALRLFKAGELFLSVPDRELEALRAFSLINLRYSESPHAPKALFVSGLVYDNQLRNPEKAREQWILFIEKYPTHPYAEQIMQLIAITDADPYNDVEMVQKWLEEAQKNQ